MNIRRHDLSCVRFDSKDPRVCNCGLQEVITEAVLFEREQSAKVADDHANDEGHDADCQGDEDCNQVIARKIREQSKV